MSPGGRHNDMPADTYVDTQAIRALGYASQAHSADLAAVASKLSAVPAATSAQVYGPVGARFLAALAEAVAHQARAVAALRDRLATAAGTADRAAAAYEDADDRASARLRV